MTISQQSEDYCNNCIFNILTKDSTEIFAPAHEIKIHIFADLFHTLIFFSKLFTLFLNCVQCMEDLWIPVLVKNITNKVIKQNFTHDWNPKSMRSPSLNVLKVLANCQKSSITFILVIFENLCNSEFETHTNKKSN